MAWSYVLCVVLAAGFFYLRNWFRACLFVLKIPGPPATPVLGNAMLLTDHDKLHELGKTAYKTYGMFFRAWLTVIPTLVLLAPEQIQVVLSSKKNTEKIYFYSLLHNFLGQGLITSSGHKWRFHRKVIQPSFHLSVLESFIATFHDSATLMVQRLGKRSDLAAVNITSPVNECVFDILHEAVLGIPLNSDPVSKSESPFRQGKVVAPYRIVHPWLLFDWIYKHTNISKDEQHQKENLYHFTTKIVQDRLKTQDSKESSSHRKAFIDYMLEASGSHDTFKEEDVVHELCTFMLAGQDSVGSALAFCLFELARHPDIQEKVVQELVSVFGDDRRAPTMTDLRQLQYLEQCVKEALRLYPSVPFILRTLSEDTKIGKMTVPAGCGILVSPFSTHRLPHIYPDPDKFDPDRFLPDLVESRHPYAFIPFSAGPRNCIGHRFAMMELKTVISTILRHFQLSSIAGHDTVKLSYRITMRASGGIWIKLTPRASLQR